jgi:hypothetical protein
MKNKVVWVVTPCSSEKARCFGGTYHLHLQGLRKAKKDTSSNSGKERFLVSLLSSGLKNKPSRKPVEAGSKVRFLQNVVPSPNCMVLQPGRLYSSSYYIVSVYNHQNIWGLQ